jgi:peptidoglycan hydrolase-like protein with peptidoglycan-binding domain
MPSLQLGSSGPDVTSLQMPLKGWGFDPGPPDGHLAPLTEAAAQAFQANVGLEVDGHVRPNTLAALDAPNIASNVTADLVAPLSTLTV